MTHFKQLFKKFIQNIALLSSQLVEKDETIKVLEKAKEQLEDAFS